MSEESGIITIGEGKVLSIEEALEFEGGGKVLWGAERGGLDDALGSLPQMVHLCIKHNGSGKGSRITHLMLVERTELKAPSREELCRALMDALDNVDWSQDAEAIKCDLLAALTDEACGHGEHVGDAFVVLRGGEIDGNILCDDEVFKKALLKLSSTMKSELTINKLIFDAVDAVIDRAESLAQNHSVPRYVSDGSRLEITPALIERLGLDEVGKYSKSHRPGVPPGAIKYQAASRGR